MFMQVNAVWARARPLEASVAAQQLERGPVRSPCVSQASAGAPHGCRGRALGQQAFVEGDSELARHLVAYRPEGRDHAAGADDASTAWAYGTVSSHRTPRNRRPVIPSDSRDSSPLSCLPKMGGSRSIAPR